MPYIFNKYYPARNIIFFLGEGLLIFLSLLFVNWLFKGTVNFLIDRYDCFQQALLVAFVFQLCLYYYDLYDLGDDLSIFMTATRITQAFGVGCIVLAVLYYLMPTIIISTRIFWTGYFLIYCLILVWRACFYYILQNKLFVQSILLVGTGKLAMDIAREIEGKYDSPYRILAFVGNKKPAYNPRKVGVYESIELLHGQLLEKQIDRIIVAFDDRRGSMPVEPLLDYKLSGIPVEQGISFYERLTGKIMVERANPSTIIFSHKFSIGRVQSLVKRCFDIGLSIVIFILALPVMVAAAIIIKFETPGPIFYSQERVGKGRKLFKILKFRSMVQDAEKDGAVWAATNDSRVTRFGGFIRKTRIDELPQLFNVIKGEMSLVGPRPERPMFVHELKKRIPYYDIRHSVRPGVTGSAQVSYPYGASEEDALRKLEYDLFYLKHISVALDLLLIFKTVKTVLFAKGGR